MGLVPNAVIHLFWGAHNLHQWIIIMMGTDKGTEGEWRRPYSMFTFCLLGGGGSACFRNFYYWASWPNEDSRVAVITGVWEVIWIVVSLVDLTYFLAKEHTWGMNMEEGYGERPHAG